MPTATSVVTQDTYLNGAAAFQAFNFSTNITAQAGWVTGGAGGAKRSLLYFPIAGVLPVSSTAITLSLFIKSVTVGGASLELFGFFESYTDSYIVGSQATWLERATAALWTAPGGGEWDATPFVNFTGPVGADDETVFSIDVTDVVLPAVVAQWAGIWLIFKNIGESGVTNQFSFCSLEGSDAFPTLTATYEDMAIRSPIIGNFKKARIYSLMSMIVPLLAGALASLVC